MKVEFYGGWYRVYRNVSDRRSYFAMYVDGTKASWSRFREQATQYGTMEAAERAIERIKALRRKGKQAT